MFAKGTTKAAISALVGTALLLAAGQTASASVKVGVLSCRVAPGIGLIVLSSKSLSCNFSPSAGKSEHYVGRVTRVGVDIGVTGAGEIVWGVFAAHSGYSKYALAGHYGGASAEASLVVGLGAQALVGGSQKSFALQPFSVKGQTGFNVAAGITGLTLTAAK